MSFPLLIRDDAVRTASPSNASSHWRLPAVWIGLFAVALAVRLPLVLRVGPTEGGADEWYAAWRAWCVLFERGNPGNFLRPALFYEAGAALFSALYLIGKQSGAFHSTVDLLTDFVRHEATYLQALQVLAAVFGALTVPVVFELGRRVSGWRAGAIAAGILAILPLHVEYSQRIRVDSLCALLTALSALALHGLVTRGRRRDFVFAGAMIGLATGANYPAALLGVAYLAAAILARRRSPSSGFVRPFVEGAVAAVVAFVLTNPYLVLTPAAAWDGFTFQLSFAVKQHPYTEGMPRWFYLDLLRDQGVPFAILAACSGVWLTVRGHGFRRILGLFPWLFIGTFIAVSTQRDRYILIAMPWLCAAIGVFSVDASSAVPFARHRTTVATASLLVVALVAAGLWRRTVPLVLVGDAEENPRWIMQRWLIQHAPAGGTVWLESDVLPLLQATFADSGGELQVRVKQAFLKAHPDFHVRILKGELVERTANFDSALITEKRVNLALTCDRNVRYVQGSGPEFASQRAFYAALAERGTRRFEARGCWIAEIT
jgi:Dolichyl-phosphate-mannose-protein mannosyltransferase